MNFDLICDDKKNHGFIGSITLTQASGSLDSKQNKLSIVVAMASGKSYLYNNTSFSLFIEVKLSVQDNTFKFESLCRV